MEKNLLKIAYASSNLRRNIECARGIREIDELKNKGIGAQQENNDCIENYNDGFGSEMFSRRYAGKEKRNKKKKTFGIRESRNNIEGSIIGIQI